MWQVDINASLVGKGHEEAVGETIVDVLGTHIGTPFETLHGVHLLGECDEGLLDALHLLRRGAVLEFKKHNVAVGGVGSRGGGHEEKDGGEGEEVFHGES